MQWHGLTQVLAVIAQCFRNRSIRKAVTLTVFAVWMLTPAPMLRRKILQYGKQLWRGGDQARIFQTFNPADDAPNAALPSPHDFVRVLFFIVTEPVLPRPRRMFCLHFIPQVRPRCR